jgi:hypothetical protein
LDITIVRQNTIVRHPSVTLDNGRIEKIIKDERQSPISDEAISGADTEYLMQAMAALQRFVDKERNTIDVTPIEGDK